MGENIPSLNGGAADALELRGDSAVAGESASKARVLIADSRPLLRYGFRHLLEEQPDMACCGEVGSVEETDGAIGANQPDLLVLDLSLQGGFGLEFIKAIRDAWPRLPILIASEQDECLYAERAI